MKDLNLEKEKSLIRKIHKLITIDVVVFFVVILSILYMFTFSAPKTFPTGRLVEIEEGMTLSDVSRHLKNSSIIRSELLFEMFTTLFAGDGGVLYGEYFFNRPLSSFGVASKVTKGEFGLDSVKIKIIEGSTKYDIANLFEKNFPDFDSIRFLKLAQDDEGYLFPDTYSFLPNVKADQVIEELKSNFTRRIEEIKEEIAEFDKPIEDIITMASIIEKEARTEETRRMISGILWKRIEIDMPLQVDAVFPYINGKNTYTLTLDDLKVDSPYNTYKYKGLPIGPIANPSLDSIKATVTPIESSYLYYLSDKSGNMYYAEDFEEHKKNKRLYLN